MNQMLEEAGITKALIDHIISPMLMISEETVKTNYDAVLNQLEDMLIDRWDLQAIQFRMRLKEVDRTCHFMVLDIRKKPIQLHLCWFVRRHWCSCDLKVGCTCKLVCENCKLKQSDIRAMDFTQEVYRTVERQRGWYFNDDKATQIQLLRRGNERRYMETLHM